MTFRSSLAIGFFEDLLFHRAGDPKLPDSSILAGLVRGSQAQGPKAGEHHAFVRRASQGAAAFRAFRLVLG